MSLTPGDTVSVTAKLEVGAASETITVVAHSELIDTTSTTVSSTISSDQIQALPLVTKNAMQIVTLLPGINANSTHVQRNSTAMGLPQSAIAIVIDGVNIQDQSVKSTDGFYADIRPQTDLVEQVTVSEATSTADSSGQGAVQIKFVTRSGSNTPTGSAYEYLRNTVLDSNSWANSSRGLPTNPVSWNQFGFRQGGPIVIPGLYDGHNRAFYFVNYEEFRLPVNAATTRTLLTPSAASGVFKYGCTAGGCAAPVDLLALAAKNGQISTIDPTIKTMLGMITQATSSGQGALQPNIDQNTEQLHLAAVSVPRRAPARRPRRLQSERQGTDHRDRDLSEGQLGSRHRQQRLPELSRLRGRQHAVFVPLYGHRQPAVDADQEPGQRRRLGTDLVAGLLLGEHHARPLRRRGAT